MPDTNPTPVLDGIWREPDHPSCAVLVMSCDAYRDLWTPFFTLFRRFWPDCPFPVYLGSTQAVFADPHVNTLAAGDSSWSRALRLCLQQIDATYVLLLLEDFFLERHVVTDTILRNLKTLEALNGIVLRLFPHPGPDSAVPEHRGVGRLHPAAPYRVSAQAALWNRSGLMDLLRDEESPWDFEWKGSKRSQAQPDGFYSTYEATLLYRQVVERGKWFWGAARYYGRQEIGCDFAARPVMSPAIALKKAINRFRKNLLDGVLPPSLRFRL